MDPVTGAALIGGVSSIAGGLIGGSKAKDEARRAQDAMARALAAFQGIKIPDTELQKLSPEMLQWLQDYAPEMEQAETLGPSGYEQIQLDPRLQQQQMAALEQLAGLSQGGLSKADVMALQQVRRGAAGEAQAKSNQILQEMQQRGQGGSGAELIARLKAAQSGADRQSVEGMQIAQMAQQRALEALTGGATLAGQVRGQQYGEQSDLARARDIVNQFNVQNRQGIQQRNVGSRNQAQMTNISGRQETSNRNVGVRNETEMYNKQLQQKRFENELAKASGMAGQYQGIASSANTAADRTARMYSGIGQGISDMAGAYIEGNKPKPPASSNNSNKK